MKILHVTGIRSSDGGGVGKHILLLSNRLKSWNIDVIVSGCEHGFFSRMVEKMGIVYKLIPGQWIMVGERRLFYRMSVTDIIKTIRKESVTVVHAHHYTVALPSAFAACLCGVPFVLTVHGFDEIPDDTRFFLIQWSVAALDIMMWKLIALFTNAFIAVSEKTKNVLMQHGVPEYKINVVLNGVDLTQFDSEIEGKSAYLKELFALEHKIVIGSVGRLDRRKGYEFLFSAYERLREKHPATKLVLVGDGEYRCSLESMAERIGIENDVVFAGYQDDIPSLLSVFDVFVLPSLSEGLPFVLLEAMAMKKAVVSTSVGGIPELIVHGLNGMLVPPADSQALERVLEELLDDSILMSRIAERGFISVKQLYSLESMVERTVFIYNLGRRINSNLKQVGGYEPR